MPLVRRIEIHRGNVGSAKMAVLKIWVRGSGASCDLIASDEDAAFLADRLFGDDYHTVRRADGFADPPRLCEVWTFDRESGGD